MLCPFSLTMLLISPLALFSFSFLPVEGEPPVMPKAEAPESIQNELILDVRMEGVQLGIRVDGRECTREELPELLKTMAQQDPDLCVRIRGDAQMTWPMMADVITTCTKAGISQVSFSKQMPKEGQ
ncbi:MAG: ExbD/TolR family protein [Akkermansia muciniphila]